MHVAREAVNAYMKQLMEPPPIPNVIGEDSRARIAGVS